MSSLTRARSLRKPAGPTALPPSERSKERNQDPNRNASPSRLPMKPASTATSRAPSSSATGRTRSTSGRVNRPGSASSNASSATAAAAPRRTTSLGKKTTTTATVTAASTAAASTTETTTTRKEGSRYPPLSSATRPVSMVMRNASDGSTTSTGTKRTTPATPARTRATSTVATATASSTSNTSTTRGAVPPVPTLTTEQRKARSRPPSRDQSSAVAPPPGTPKRRAISVDKPPPTTPIPTNATTATAATGPGQAPRLNRPAFSTLQQRFSPAKTSSPKPPTANYTAPPSPSKLPANIAASVETSRLQAELLQLHLLHRDAVRVEAQWRASAKSKLGERFRVVRDAHRQLADREAAEAEGDNIAALQHWAVSAGRGTGALDDGVRVLDSVVGGAWMMSEPGGKYARVVRRFERWIERVMDLEEARESGGGGGGSGGGGSHSQSFRSSNGAGGGGGGVGGVGGGMEEALFIQDLDTAWTEECMSMTRKLEGWQAQLGGTGYQTNADTIQDGNTRSTSNGSSLERMLEGSRALIGDMLSELSAMEEIRQAALAREEDWIERMNRDDDDNDTPRAGAVWRAM